MIDKKTVLDKVLNIQIPFWYFSKTGIKNAVFPTILLYTILQTLHY